MPAPSDYPDFATDTNFTNGPDVGTPTKVEPSAGELAEGHIRGTSPAAQKFNWWMNLVGKWVRWFGELQPASIMVPADRVSWVTATIHTAGPALNALGVRLPIDGTYIEDNPNNPGTGVDFLMVDTGAAQAQIYTIPLTEFLGAHNGRTITGIAAHVVHDATHVDLPDLMPRIALCRVGPGGSRTSLCSTTWNVDPSASLGAYISAHAISATADQNNVIDLSAWSYELLFHYEGGTNALAGGQLRHLILTLDPLP